MPSSPSSWSLMIGAGGAYYLRQAEDRGAGPAAGRQDRQHSGARGHDRHRRYPAARRRDRQQSLGVHRQRVRAEGALRTQARRISVPEERQPARCHRHHGRGQGGAARRHDSRRPDLRTDRGPAFRQRYFLGLGPRNAARRHAAAGNLQIPARHHPRAGDRAHAAGAEARACGNLGAPQSGHSDQDAGAAGDAGLDRREGNRQGRTSAAGSPRCSSTGCGRR